MKKITAADFNELYQMANHIWNQHYVPIIGQAQVDYMLQNMYSPQALQAQMDQGQIFYFIHNQQQAIGFIGISKQNGGFIHKFYISPQFQNKGIGAQVFELIKTELNQPMCIELTVNRQNYKSINFYFKCGFIIKQVADFDIGNGYYMNDFVMQYCKNKTAKQY